MSIVSKCVPMIWQRSVQLHAMCADWPTQQSPTRSCTVTVLCTTFTTCISKQWANAREQERERAEQRKSTQRRTHALIMYYMSGHNMHSASSHAPHMSRSFSAPDLAGRDRGKVTPMNTHTHTHTQTQHARASTRTRTPQTQHTHTHTHSDTLSLAIM